MTSPVFRVFQRVSDTRPTTCGSHPWPISSESILQFKNRRYAAILFGNYRATSWATSDNDGRVRYPAVDRRRKGRCRQWSPFAARPAFGNKRYSQHVEPFFIRALYFFYFFWPARRGVWLGGFGELAAGIIKSFKPGERFLFVHFSLLRGCRGSFSAA